MYRVWNFLSNYSLLLILGALSGLVWANLAPESYHAVIDFALAEDFVLGVPHEEGGDVVRTLTVHFLINDVLMALFFAMAGKEVWEAIALERGPLRGTKALTPLIATAGGMLGPVAVYLGLAWAWGVLETTAHGWAIPTATDIAFSYLVGRAVFGAGHPAIRFLLLLAIADDAGGLLILAVFYPTGPVAPAWLILSFGAAAAVFALFNWLPRRLDRGNQLRPTSTWVRRKLSFWPYLVAGCLSWYGFQQAGIHPALGLLPVIPAVPHADRAFGIFAEAEEHLGDLLNAMEHGLKHVVEVVLFLFGFANAGVHLSAVSEATWLVFFGLLVGKPAGIFLFGWLAARPLRLGLPRGMSFADLWVMGCVAAIGFTVALFVATVAFPPGPVQDAAKMGALFSVAASAVAVAMGRLLRIGRVPG
ncbi:MAG: Na+/H+ antiporter NhaA [Rhodobacteraceae bacterium]|nr:Na+/H+ antiporter NhaA [Paracoccaceae bacterium]